MADPAGPGGAGEGKRGFLTKQGGGNKAKTWKKRLFVLEGHTLSYYKNSKATAPLGIISLSGCTISPADSIKKKNCFQVYHPIRRTFYIYAESQEEMLDWMTAIREHVPRSDSSLLTYKIVMLGAGGVGKSALTLQFVNNMFLADYEPTIEDSFLKQLTVDGQSCRLSILDTAGQEEYTTITDQYIEVGEGFVLVFDITSAASFEDVKKVHSKVRRVTEAMDDLPPMVLVGNKVDLVDLRQVEKETAESLAAQFGCPYFEASALTRENVENVFHEITRIMRANDAEDDVNIKRDKKCIIS
ncbi:Psmras1, variant [Thecamonas trahens ATCC 50062]|uniref:small monomeric GTPase n=1 Tax=Thecamonas trahens ATCC 50062 TaxID=461836 RepID=A0A0L0DPU1_THETB|nr:Psmras1, variant [Thecamonas trahens ATCC 50062]KNC54324.1 Psmras1, variant [Thecamonas trahens ATCC 50062]|eukprot:XP_013753783.1 Psmras1, variant [Thecamonas trahens ATCC 50062]